MKYIHTALCQLVQQEEIVAHLTQPDFGTFSLSSSPKKIEGKKKCGHVQKEVCILLVTPQGAFVRGVFEFIKMTNYSISSKCKKLAPIKTLGVRERILSFSLHMLSSYEKTRFGVNRQK
jgi:hypothetical protein